MDDKDAQELLEDIEKEMRWARNNPCSASETAVHVVLRMIERARYRGVVTYPVPS